METLSPKPPRTPKTPKSAAKGKKRTREEIRAESQRKKQEAEEEKRKKREAREQEKRDRDAKKEAEKLKKEEERKAREQEKGTVYHYSRNAIFLFERKLMKVRNSDRPSSSNLAANVEISIRLNWVPSYKCKFEIILRNLIRLRIFGFHINVKKIFIKMTSVTDSFDK